MASTATGLGDFPTQSMRVSRLGLTPWQGFGLPDDSVADIENDYFFDASASGQGAGSAAASVMATGVGRPRARGVGSSSVAVMVAGLSDLVQQAVGSASVSVGATGFSPAQAGATGPAWLRGMRLGVGL